MANTITSAPAEDPTEVQQAWENMLEAYRVTRQAVVDALDKQCRLPWSHFAVLTGFQFHMPDGAGRISDILPFVAPLSQPAVSRIVQTMERERLLTRQPDPADSRASILRLTPAGKRAYTRARAVTQQAVAESFGRFMTAQEAEVLASVLGRIGREKRVSLEGAAAEGIGEPQPARRGNGGEPHRDLRRHRD